MGNFLTLKRLLIIFVSVFLAAASTYAAERYDSIAIDPGFSRPMSPLNYSLYDWERPLSAVTLKVLMRVALVNIPKKHIHEWRPDGSADNSFPSRHAVWGYGIAGTLTYALGHQAPWIGVVSHTGANIIGMQRVMARRHWPGDVLAGAGLGIGIDIAARGICNCIFGDSHLYHGFTNNSNPLCSNLIATTGARIPLRGTYGNYTLGTAFTSGLQAIYATNDHMGLCADLQVASAPVKSSVAGDVSGPVALAGILNGISGTAGVVGSINPSDGPVAIGASVKAGYCQYLSIKEVAAPQGAFIASADVYIILALTRSLGVGAVVGYSTSSLRLGAASHAYNSLNLGFLSRVNF